jgi:hypothetical protein
MKGLGAAPTRLEGTAAAAQQALPASSLVSLGFVHVLPEGLDHVLFVIALTLTVGWFLHRLMLLVVCFTGAHLIALLLSVTRIVTVPGEIVEPLIALSIAVTAGLGIWGARDQKRPLWQEIPLVLAFGIIHGLGFGAVLLDLDLTGGHLLRTVLLFHVGIELAHLLVAGVTLAVLAGLARLKALARLTPERALAAGVALGGCAMFLSRVTGL